MYINHLNEKYNNFIIVKENELNYKLRDKYTFIGVDTDKISSKVIKYSPDFIKLNSLKHIKKSLINICKEHSIFIQISLSEFYRDKIFFSTLIKKLNVYRAWRCMVVYNDISDDDRIFDILAGFGYRKRNVQRIIDNSDRMIKNAIRKRFSTKNVFISLQDNPELMKIFYNQN